MTNTGEIDNHLNGEHIPPVGVEPVTVYTCRHVMNGDSDGDFAREFALAHGSGRICFIICRHCNRYLARMLMVLPGFEDSEIIPGE